MYLTQYHKFDSLHMHMCALE